MHEVLNYGSTQMVWSHNGLSRLYKLCKPIKEGKKKKKVLVWLPLTDRHMPGAAPQEGLPVTAALCSCCALRRCLCTACISAAAEGAGC